MSGTIVVGYVPRPEGKAALERAVEEAQLRGATLVVVNSHKGGQDYAVAEAIRTEDELAEVTNLLDEAEVEYEVRELVRGNEPGDDLLAIATERNAIMIIIGLRRRSPVGKLLLGSNSQKVLLNAVCPVLTVKG